MKPRTVYVLIEMETAYSMSHLKELYRDPSNMGWGMDITVNQVQVNIADATKKKAKRRKK